ncbi:MAG: ATP-dependent RNA helicase dbp7 [Thelocarpon impressellum]|nr:MAG: ATP-dependent RNA helicase dbp7 [Thelocarpon impressellum]
MADTDGMLVNFDIGNGPLITKQTFTGGRWRDRVRANKVARHHQRKAARPKDGTATKYNGQNGPLVEVDDDTTNKANTSPRPVKRQRVEDESTSAGSRGTGRPSKSSSSHQAKGKDREIISSLFSFNPASTTAADKATHEEGPAEASNAPILDGISTFLNLGLSNTLSTHLLTKLELKAPTAIQKAAVPQLIKDDSDAFIQAETGSGKTLAYLLPIVQRIMEMSRKQDEDVKVHRDSGLFAIVLAPTRELCKQISVVLDSLLRCAHWIVAGTVIGGEKKKSEKARLRKGLNILVATPGRLADHLDNTEVLDVSNVRWLVLDEGDRLMELGFEEEIQGIVAKLESRSGISKTPGASDHKLPHRRVTVLCSATMKMNVQRLGEISLKDAVHLKADPGEGDDEATTNDVEDAFSAPAQLQQAFAVVPAKLRLVTLTAVLKRAFHRRGSVMKAIVFMSCADSVDFHFDLLTRAESEGTTLSKPTQSSPTTTTKTGSKSKETSAATTVGPCPTLSSPENAVTLYKLHGSLAQPIRTSTLAAFTGSKCPSLLIATDVASRGLDLPNVDLVLEYDPPFSRDEHLHRVGRTARAGRPGRALIFLLPGGEEGYTAMLRAGKRHVARHTADELLRKGFASNDWEARATQFQLDAERWTLASPRALEGARRAFQSHVRAYATHVAAERGVFDIKALHLGHLAKAFALRDRPGSINVPGLRGTTKGGKSGGRGRTTTHREEADGQTKTPAVAEAKEASDAARRMRAKMREHMSGISEFNLG